MPFVPRQAVADSSGPSEKPSAKALVEVFPRASLGSHATDFANQRPNDVVLCPGSKSGRTMRFEPSWKDESMSLLWWLMIAALMVASACGNGSDGGDDAAPSPAATEVVAEDQPVPSTEEQTTSTPVPTSVPTSAAEIVLPITGWKAVVNGTNLWFTEIIVVDGEFIATGNETGRLVPEPRSGVWRSTDGVTWVESLVFDATIDSGEPRVDVGDLTVVDGRIMALAKRYSGMDWPRADDKELVEFSSDDGGISWSETVLHSWGAANYRELAIPPTFAYGDPDVVFAVEGSAGDYGGGDDTITGSMVWIRTSDGWDFIDPTESGLVWVWAMAATEDGFVALADIREPVEGFADCQTQALWTSPDARSWTRVWTNDRDCEWFSINQLITVDGDLLAVGNSNDVIVISLDGEDGDVEPLDAPVRVFRITDQAIEDRPIEPAAFADMFLTDVEINDGVIIAIGCAFDFRESHIWLSVDAETWTLADIPADELTDKELFQVAMNGDNVIVLGMEITPAGPGEFVTWSSTMR